MRRDHNGPIASRRALQIPGCGDGDKHVVSITQWPVVIGEQLMVSERLTFYFRFGHPQKNDNGPALGAGIALGIRSQGFRHFRRSQVSRQLRRERTDNLGGLKIASTSPDKE